MAARRLLRLRAGRKLAGVALGFAHYLDVDVTLVRILWVILTLLTGGMMLVGYFVAWILMPEEDPAALPAPTEPAARS